MSTSRFSFLGVVIWLVCAIFFMYEFLLRTILGTFEHPVMYDLNLNLVKFAILSTTAYTVIYGFMQIPAGIITDRWGLKKTLFGASLICACSVVAFGLTHSYQSALLFRMLMGFGSSFGFICLLVAVYDWFPRNNTAFYIGLSQFIGTMGPIMAAGPIDSLTKHSAVDWRIVFLGLGVVGFFISGLILALVRNNKDFTGSFQILKRPEPLLKHCYALFQQRQVWLIALFSGAIYFAIEYLSESSGKAFLMLHGYSSNSASYMLTSAWVGYAIGCPLLGFISDRSGKRKPMMLLSTLLCLVALCIIVYFPINIYLLWVGFVLLGIGASGQSIGFAIVAEQCHGAYLALGLGLNNACIALTTSINAPLISWLLVHFTEEASPKITDYQQAFLVMFILLLMALFITFFAIKETFNKSTKEAFILKQSLSS